LQVGKHLFLKGEIMLQTIYWWIVKFSIFHIQWHEKGTLGNRYIRRFSSGPIDFILTVVDNRQPYVYSKEEMDKMRSLISLHDNRKSNTENIHRINNKRIILP
jgi:hypothetical protein